MLNIALMIYLGFGLITVINLIKKEEVKNNDEN